jgi:hypothetical protein
MKLSDFRWYVAVFPSVQRIVPGSNEVVVCDVHDSPLALPEGDELMFVMSLTVLLLYLKVMS